MNKYIKNYDEEKLAKDLDDSRKEFCSSDYCKICPFSLPDEKCLLITAENKLSQRNEFKLRNMMRHFNTVSKFLLSLPSFELSDGRRVVREEAGVYSIQTAEYPYGQETMIKADGALELIRELNE